MPIASTADLGQNFILLSIFSDLEWLEICQMCEWHSLTVQMKKLRH